MASARAARIFRPLTLALVAGAIAPLGLLGGCIQPAAPRVVAERLFPRDEITLHVASYADHPNVRPRVWSVGFRVDGVATELPYELRTVPPGNPNYPVRLRFSLPAKARRAEVVLWVDHGPRRYRLAVRFRRADRPHYRWRRSSECLWDVGPAPPHGPPVQQGDDHAPRAVPR